MTYSLFESAHRMNLIKTPKQSHAYILLPFQTVPEAKAYTSVSPTLTGQLTVYAGEIEMTYIVSGNLDTLRIPLPVVSPLRMDHLWEHSCFELFVAVQQQAAYWEFNFSPAGHWNAYGFSSPRQGMQPEAQIKEVYVLTKKMPNQLVLTANVPLLKAWKNVKLDIGISAILQDQQNTRRFFALQHRGEKPDFHQRETFILSVSTI